MSAPLSRFCLLAAIAVLIASIFQKDLAAKLGQPMTEPTSWERVLGGVKDVVAASKAETAALVAVPEHPVAQKIFYAAVGVAILSLVAWVLETAFWLPLLAMVLALAAVFVKIAWLPALLALLKTTAAKTKSTTKRRSATKRSSR
jgi:Mlc titration factor MtfA (ptsG expression regulator)